MALFSLTRLVLFVLCTLFSFIVLGILCNFTSITNSEGFYYHSFALGIATSLFTIIGIIAVLVIDKLRKEALVSLVWFELLWTGFLWILWLATAASITSLGVFTSCGYPNSVVESTCRQYQAAQAFSWLIWLMIFGWFVTLLVLSFISHSRGNTQIWFSGTNDADFLGGGKGKTEYGQGVTPQITGYTNSSAPGPQYGHYGGPQQYQGAQQYADYPQQYPSSPPPQQPQYTGSTSAAYPPQGYPQQGYPQQGYPQQGYGQPVNV